MLTIRPVNWDADAVAVARIDTSFTTDRIYALRRTGLSFALVEIPVDPPRRKDYGRPTSAGLAEDGPLDDILVAERDGEVLGLVAGRYARWNRRYIVWHLYVDRRARGTGIGRALLEAIEPMARTAGALRLWLETQNINYPAVQFYRRQGFQLVGLDESLYDPTSSVAAEVALYFARDIPS